MRGRGLVHGRGMVLRELVILEITGKMLTCQYYIEDVTSKAASNTLTHATTLDYSIAVISASDVKPNGLGCRIIYWRPGFNSRGKRIDSVCHPYWVVINDKQFVHSG